MQMFIFLRNIQTQRLPYLTQITLGHCENQAFVDLPFLEPIISSHLVAAMVIAP